jgi:AAA domain/Bifunctional DNA primase/polymerase, N-terminal
MIADSRRRSKAPLTVPDVTGMNCREAAHAYLDAGFVPVPWVPREGEKILHPRLMKGAVLHEWVTTHKWIDTWPSNVRCGLLTSRSGGIIAADLDDISTFEAWDADADFMDDQTAVSRSGRGGGARHIVYDARELDEGSWPTQGNIPGGQVKSNGFIAVEPSRHPNGRPYRWDPEPRTLAPIGALGPFLARYRQSANGHGPARDHSRLAHAAGTAPPGEQHESLRDYAWDLARLGLDEEEAMRLLEAKAAGLRLDGRPWRERDLLALFRTAAGKVHGQARGAEADELEGDWAGDRPARGGVIEWASSFSTELVEWLWPDYLAFHEMTCFDGESSMGKSFTTYDVAARYTLGLPMPGQAEAACEPGNVVIFTDEGRKESVIIPRLRAAKADLRRIAFPVQGPIPKPGSKSRGKWDLALPDGARRHRQVIQAASAGLAIWDPIADFIGENIQTHNDASYRRAVRPLGVVLQDTGAAGWLIRHMNKDHGSRAKYRGSGAMALQNRARVHLVAGELPVSAHPQAKFGIAMVDSNLGVRVDRTLAYSIIDSDIVQDKRGRMVGRVEWHGMININADLLTRGDQAGHGPRPAKRRAVEEILTAMFGEKDPWTAKEVKQRIESELGELPADHTLRQARDRCGIRVFKRRGSMVFWWTQEPSRVRNG